LDIWRKVVILQQNYNKTSKNIKTMQILAVIKKHGFRLEDVANALGITKGSLSATINGSPNVKKLIEIALVIGCSPAEFFGDWYENEGKAAQKPSQPAQQPAAESASAEQQQAVSGEGGASGLPFGCGEPSAIGQQAIVCPHCHQALVFNIASYEQK